MGRGLSELQRSILEIIHDAGGQIVPLEKLRRLCPGKNAESIVCRAVGRLQDRGLVQRVWTFRGPGVIGVYD
jgi:hypothetical protein